MPASEDRRPLGERVGLWTAPVLLIAAVTIAGVRVTEPEPRDRLDRYIGPTSPGTTWVYETTAGGEPSGLHVSQVIGEAFMSEGRATVYEEYTENQFGLGAPSRSWGYQGRRGDALVSYGSREAGSFEAEDPPGTLLRLPIEVGERWTSAGTSGGAEFESTAEMVALERVRVPAGEFDDCAHVHRETVLEEGTVNAEVWFCPDVGVTRLQQDGFGLVLDQQLVELHAPGRNLGSGALPALEPSAGAVLGGGPGFDPGHASWVPDGQLDLSSLAWSDARRANIDFPPAGGDGTLVVADEDGLVSSTDVRTGVVGWRVRLRGPIPAPPVAAGPVVLVGDAEKRVWALDASTGYARWSVRLPDILAAAPAWSGETVYVVGDDRRIRALRLADGEEMWSEVVPALVRTSPAVTGDVVIVADEEGRLTAFSLDDGTQAWATEMLAPFGAGPVAADGLVLAADGDRTVYAFDAATGDERWTETVLGEVNLEPAAGAGIVVVLPFGEDVQALSLTDGRELWKHRLPGNADVPAAIVGDRVVVLTRDARLHTYALDGTPTESVPVPAPAEDASVSTSIPMSFVDGSLVVPLAIGGAWPFTWLSAYPATAEAPTSGVRFTGELREVPATPVSPPTPLGGDLLFSSQDGGVYRAGPGTEAVEVHRAEDPPPFAVAAGDLVLTMEGEDLVAVPAEGGDPAWTFPIGEQFFGASVAVDDGTAYVAVAGQGLVALELRTGEPVWLHQSAGQGVGHPVLTSGGVVSYAVGGLYGVDAQTGRELWSVPGVIGSLAAPASDGETVYAAALGSRDSWVIAVDARSGVERWRVPLALPLFGTPVVAGDVVAVPDEAGVVHVFDAATGEERWAFPTETGTFGMAAVDGRLLVAAAPRDEDLNQREFVVTAFDPGTGRFLGSFEPQGAPFTFVSSIGTSDEEVFLPYTAHQSVIGLFRLEAP